ncbi:MAG: hypothetical protein V4555_16465 [Acidobacteriota bacterium]
MKTSSDFEAAYVAASTPAARRAVVKEFEVAAKAGQVAPEKPAAAVNLATATRVEDFEAAFQVTKTPHERANVRTAFSEAVKAGRLTKEQK